MQLSEFSTLCFNDSKVYLTQLRLQHGIIDLSLLASNDLIYCNNTGIDNIFIVYQFFEI